MPVSYTHLDVYKRQIQNTKTLRIAAVAGGAPNYQKDLATGAWSGIMIDLANNLATKLGAKLEITETTWGNACLLYTSRCV